MSFDRGTIVLVDLNPARGHEQAGKRPALILSNDKLNKNAAELITILPLTTRPRDLATRIRVDPPEGRLRERSWVIGEQIRTISTERIIDTWGTVSPVTIAAVEKVVKYLLQLKKPE